MGHVFLFQPPPSSNNKIFLRSPQTRNLCDNASQTEAESAVNVTEEADVENLAPRADINSIESDLSQEYAEVNFICKESAKCKRKFKSSNGLKNHITLCHKPDSFVTCDICGKGFKQNKHLKQHKKVHEKLPVRCDQCGTELPNEFRLKQHKEQYHTLVSPKCQVCGQIFENRATQRMHNKTCLKKNNRLKYQNKENIAPQVPAVNTATVDKNKEHNVPQAPNGNTVAGKGTTNEKEISFQTSPSVLNRFPLSSVESPTLVENLPVVSVLSFDEF